MDNNLTQARLKELLEYDPETGVFTWRVTQFRERWAGRIAGTHDGRGYRQIRIDKRFYLGHRLAWLYVYGEWPSGEIDHINLNKDDNRIANLRVVSKSENQHNRTKQANNSSGFKGVHKKRNKWTAGIWVGNKKHYLGSFHDPELAHKAYCEAAKRLHKDFARTA